MANGDADAQGMDEVIETVISENEDETPYPEDVAAMLAAMPDSWNAIVAKMPESLILAEAAFLLRFSRENTSELAQEGSLPGTRVGDGPKAPWRFVKSELLHHVGVSPDTVISENEDETPYPEDVAAMLAAMPDSWNAIVAKMPESLILAEAAFLLRFSRPKTNHLAATGSIPGTRVGDGPKAPWRFAKSELLKRVRIMPGSLS